jgi:hypothetical protein
MSGLTAQEREELQSKDIAELRAIFRQSNQERKFQRSREIHTLIQSKLYAASQEAVDQATKDLTVQLRTTFTEFNTALSQTKTEFKQRENYHREAIDDSFAELTARQLTQFTELEIEMRADKLRESHRQSFNVRDLNRISVVLANRAEFDGAVAVEKAGASLARIEQDDRFRELKLTQDKLRRNLYVQFDTEIQVLEERLLKGLQGIQDQMNIEIKSHQRQCAVAVQTVLLRSIHDTIKKVGKREKDADITARLTRHARNEAQKYGMNRKLTFD